MSHSWGADSELTQHYRLQLRLLLPGIRRTTPVGRVGRSIRRDRWSGRGERWKWEVMAWRWKTLDMRQNPLIQLYSYRAKKCYRAIRALQCLDSRFVSQTLSISWSLNDGDFRRNIGVFQKISGIKVEETKEPLTLWTKEFVNRASSFIDLKLLEKPVLINIVLANERLQPKSFSRSINSWNWNWNSF